MSNLASQHTLHTMLSFRGLNAVAFLIAVVGMAFALVYLQGHLGLDPCPLCIFQRVGLMVMGAFALAGLILNPKRLWARLLLWTGGLAGVLWGAGVAARHVYLQHLPPEQVPACGPGLSYWVDTLPMSQVLSQVLSGSGECAEIDWSFLGLSIPMQTLILFVVLAGIYGLMLWRILKSVR